MAKKGPPRNIDDFILHNGNYKEALLRVLKKFHIDENGCWIWEGYTRSNGYGELRIHQSLYKVHRFMAFCFLGLDIYNLYYDTCHKCDVRNCINPAHLFVGTRFDNLKDMTSKGRRRNQFSKEKS